MLHPEQRAGTSGTANVAPTHPPQHPATGPSQPPQSQEGSTMTQTNSNGRVLRSSKRGRDEAMGTQESKV